MCVSQGHLLHSGQAAACVRMWREAPAPRCGARVEHACKAPSGFSLARAYVLGAAAYGPSLFGLALMRVGVCITETGGTTEQPATGNKQETALQIEQRQRQATLHVTHRNPFNNDHKSYQTPTFELSVI